MATTKKIIRHRIDKEFMRNQASRYATSLAETLKGAAADASLLSMLSTTARSYAGYLAIVDPESPEICRALQIGAKSSTAILLLAESSSSSSEVWIAADWKVTLPATGSNSSAHAGKWLAGFYMAAICRDTETLNQLANVPVDLLRASSTRAGDYLYLFIEALQNYQKGELKTSFDRLTKALDATDPEEIKTGSVDYALDITVQEINLVYRLLQGDEAGLNLALAQALSRHKKYWSREADYKIDPAGFLAYGPLAISCMAFDKGLSIQVTSDYMPKRLLEGACR